MSVPNRLHQQPYFYFAIALVIAIVGFWPSFFNKLGRTDAAHLIHGFSATAWMAVPVLQAFLISRGHYQMHKQIGRVALALVPIVFVSGLYMIQLMIRGAREDQEILILKLAFLDIVVMILFVVFVVLAIRSIRENDMESHARYLAASVLFALEPAVERVFATYLVSDFEQALYLSLISMEIIVAVLLFIEWRRGAVHPPFAITFVAFAAIHIFATPVAESAGFKELAQSFANPTF